MQTVVTTGRVMAPTEAQLAASVAATVEKVYVEKGDQVEQGKVLVELDASDARVALAQAKAAWARARAQQRQVSSVSAQVLDQALVQAQARLDEAERRHRDNQRLFDSGAIARAELDRSATELELAKSQLAAARTRASGAAPGGPEAASASAALQLAEAELRAAKVQLARSRIRAPVSGVVLMRNVEPGEVATPGRTLLVVARSGLQELVIEPDEKNLSLLELGQEATASAEAFPDRRFRARVSFIAPSVDPRRGTVEVRLEVAKPPEYLRPSMTVSVEVEVARKKAALVLDSSVVRDLAGPSSWVLVARDGRAERRDVTIGLRGDRKVEILSGVDPAMRVIVPRQPPLAAGARVRVEGE